MSDEFCAGVKILLKRMESHPEEFKDRGKWEVLTRAVFAHKEGNFAEAWVVRSLTHAEIDALYEGFVKLDRPAFDEWVMKEVLAEPEEKHWAAQQMAQASLLRLKRSKEIIGSWNDPRMLAQSSVFTVTAGGGGGSGQVQIKPESVMSKLKKGLGL
jgi:hypothetical protein